MPPDHMIPKHDFTKRPDPEREMELRITLSVPVFGRERQVAQTRQELLRYARLHLSPDVKEVSAQIRDIPKPLLGVPLDQPTANGSTPPP